MKPVLRGNWRRKLTNNVSHAIMLALARLGDEPSTAQRDGTTDGRQSRVRVEALKDWSILRIANGSERRPPSWMI
jgi:hypothetical protein